MPNLTNGKIDSTFQSTKKGSVLHKLNSLINENEFKSEDWSHPWNTQPFFKLSLYPCLLSTHCVVHSTPRSNGSHHLHAEKFQHSKQNLISFFSPRIKIFAHPTMLSWWNVRFILCVWFESRAACKHILYSTHLSINGIPYHEMPIVCWTIDVRQIRSTGLKEREWYDGFIWAFLQPTYVEKRKPTESWFGNEFSTALNLSEKNYFLENLSFYILNAVTFKINVC